MKMFAVAAGIAAAVSAGVGALLRRGGDRAVPDGDAYPGPEKSLNLSEVRRQGKWLG